MPTDNIHGTVVALADATGAPQGVLLRGPSGSGKSDLALRLIDAGAVLVADDRVDLSAVSNVLWAAVPAPLAGLLEVRGVGVLRVPHLSPIPVAAVIDLVSPGDVARLPPPETIDLLDIAVPCFRLAAFEASTVAKVRAVLAVVKAPEKVIR